MTTITVSATRSTTTIERLGLGQPLLHGSAGSFDDGASLAGSLDDAASLAGSLDDAASLAGSLVESVATDDDDGGGRDANDAREADESLVDARADDDDAPVAAASATPRDDVDDGGGSGGSGSSAAWLVDEAIHSAQWTVTRVVVEIGDILTTRWRGTAPQAARGRGARAAAPQRAARGRAPGLGGVRGHGGPVTCAVFRRACCPVGDATFTPGRRW